MSNFCAGCGEEIEPNDWKSLLIRPYCENCQPDYKLQRLLPLICLGIASLGVIYGFGTYLKSPDKPASLITTNGAETTTNKNRNLQNQLNQQISKSANVQNFNQKTLVDNDKAPANAPDSPAVAGQKTPGGQNPAEKVPITADEAIYICGAQTKKGTPCLRRVKGGGRCWQHLGQPAMLPPAKLLVSR